MNLQSIQTALAGALLLAAFPVAAQDPQAVYVILKNQPQRAIVERMRAGVTPEIAFAEQDMARESAGLANAARRVEVMRRRADSLTRLRQAAIREIEAATVVEQSVIESRIAGLGGTEISRFVALNMLSARLPVAAFAALSEAGEIAEVISGENLDHALIEKIDAALRGSNDEVFHVEGQPGGDGFTRLLDRIADDWGITLVNNIDDGGMNRVREPSAATVDRLRGAGVWSPMALRALASSTEASQERTGEIGAGFQLYRARPAGPLSAALTWNRHFGEGVAPMLAGLGLDAFDESDGREVARSRTPGGNREQVRVDGDGRYVVKVSADSAAAERFALALSEGEYELARGPELRVRCGEASNAANRCVVANEGDLPVFDVEVVADAAAPQGVGVLRPGESIGLEATGAMTAQGIAFNQTFSSSIYTTNCLSFSVTPPAGPFPQAGGNFTVRVNTGTLNCVWEASVDAGASGWISFLNPRYAGPQNFPFRLAANTTTAIRTGRINFYVIQTSNSGFLGDPGTTSRIHAGWVDIPQAPPAAPPANPPEVVITNPTNSTILTPTTTSVLAIIWQLKGEVAGNVKIDLLDNRGVIVKTATVAAAALRYNMPLAIADVAPANGLYRVRITHVTNAAINDTTLPFAIRYTPFINVTAPAQLRFYPGQTLQVAWIYRGDDALKVDVELRQGANSVAFIARQLPITAGKASYTLPRTLKGQNYLVRVFVPANSGYKGESYEFEVKAPSINLANQAGNVTFQAGAALTLNWTHDADPTEKVNIQLSGPGGAHTLATNLPVNNKTARIVLPGSLSSGVYTLKIVYVSHPEVSDIDIIEVAARAWIRVTSPNGGEQINPAQTPNLPIRWTYDPKLFKATDTVQILLVPAAAADLVLKSSVSIGANGVGTYQHNAGALKPGKYKIKVQFSSSLFDLSDAEFTIVIPGGVTVTAPGANAVWRNGNNTVAWTVTGTPGPVNIVVENLATKVKRTIAQAVNTATAKSLAYNFTAANFPLGDYQVHLVSTGPQGTTWSSGRFKFAGVTVVAPNGAAAFPGGTNMNVTWNYTGPTPATAVIQLVSAAGATNVAAIPNAVEGANQRQVAIPVLQAPRSDYLVRVVVTAGGQTFSDDSNAAVSVPGLRLLPIAGTFAPGKEVRVQWEFVGPVNGAFRLVLLGPNTAISPSLGTAGNPVGTGSAELRLPANIRPGAYTIEARLGGTAVSTQTITVR